jgi:hypothetical protein
MPRTIAFSANAAKPPATYSQAVKAAGLVFVSGTAPVNPRTHLPVRVQSFLFVFLASRFPSSRPQLLQGEATS